MHKIRISGLKGFKSVSIVFDVIEYDIPLLLSIDSMKKPHTQINYMDASVAIFETELDVMVTQSGHVAFQWHLPKVVKFYVMVKIISPLLSQSILSQMILIISIKLR